MESRKILLENSRNYFIMDSETLVSNPFQEMTNEAMDASGKRSSITERLVSVKNNVCEKHFMMKADKLQKEMTHNMKKIHENASKLRYEAKLFDINKRKIDLETKRRIHPKKNYNYDESQIQKSEQRLGVLDDGYYLDRKQKFPIRGRNMNDLNATPTVSKARLLLRQQEREDREDDFRSMTLTQLGFSTPATTSFASSSKGSVRFRRDSKSAPPSKMTVSMDSIDSKLPSIERQKTKDSHVKFSMDDSYRTSTPDHLPDARPKTYTATSTSLTRRSTAWDSDDDEDFVQAINLRALLFGSETKSTTTPRTFTRASSVSVPSLRKSGSRITRETILAENKKINNKINKFYESLQMSEEESESDPEPEVEVKVTAAQGTKFAQKVRAATMLKMFSKPKDEISEEPKKTSEVAKPEAHVPRPVSETKSEVLKRRFSILPEPNPETADTSIESEVQTDVGKNLWKFIRANVENGEVKRCQTPSQIILQQMTRLDLTENAKTKIPLHSAGRALRHTPTFKMRKVVEKLMKNRTKFQQQEVDLLRQKLEDGTVNQDPGNPTIHAAA